MGDRNNFQVKGGKSTRGRLHNERHTVSLLCSPGRRYRSAWRVCFTALLPFGLQGHSQLYPVTLKLSRRGSEISAQKRRECCTALKWKHSSYCWTGIKLKRNIVGPAHRWKWGRYCFSGSLREARVAVKGKTKEFIQVFFKLKHMFVGLMLKYWKSWSVIINVRFPS